jgi:hypothetical protein
VALVTRTFRLSSFIVFTAIVTSAGAQKSAKSPAPPKPGAPPAQTESAAPLDLVYRLKTGQVFVYSVKIQLDGAQSVETLSGPAVWRVISTEDGSTLRFQSALETHRRLKEGADEASAVSILAQVRRLGQFRTGASDAENTLKIDSRGAILRQGGDSALPSFLGSLARLLLESLPDKPAAAWDTSAEGNLSVVPVAKDADRVSLPSREKCAYTVQATPGAPRVKKQYELAARETVGGEPRVKITGQGTTTFDSKTGMPADAQFEGTVAEASKNKVDKTLVTINCKLLDGDDRTLALQELNASRGIAEDDDPPIRDAELIALLTELKSGNKSARKAAADKLASWPPNENRGRVARALAAALMDSDLFVRWSAVTALGAWYTKETVPDLIRRLDDAEHAVRWETEKVLGAIRDPRACMPLAIMVDKGTDRDFAANALEEMGPIAEEVAVKLLGSYAWEARNRAAKMLAHWGTKESVPTLRQHLRDTNGIVAMSAQEALRNIGARTGP